MLGPRSIPILAIASLALVLVALPAGAYNEAVNTGTTALYTITDEAAAPGVVCRYRDTSPDINDRLRRILIRPFFSHGPFESETYVGYRFLIKRQKYPYSGPFKTVYRSPIIKKLANQTEVAFFPARDWTAPEGTKARFRAQIVLYWYAKGSTSDVIGRARGLMEAYKHRLGPGTEYTLGDQGSPAWCRADYHGLL